MSAIKSEEDFKVKFEGFSYKISLLFWNETTKILRQFFIKKTSTQNCWKGYYRLNFN